MAESFNNPLVDAADLGQKDKVAALLKSGYKPDTKGDFGVTALMRASFRGNLEIVHLLLENGAYVNATDIGGETALHLAARNGYPDVVKELLNSEAFIDIPDKENWTPLMRAITAKQTEVANILINKGADLTAVNERGESVLVHAAIIGKPEIMKMILGSNNFTKIPEEQKKNALVQAEKKGNEEVGKMLSATNQYIKKQNEKKPDTEIAGLSPNSSKPSKTDDFSGSVATSPAPKTDAKSSFDSTPLLTSHRPSGDMAEAKDWGSTAINPTPKSSESPIKKPSAPKKSTAPATSESADSNTAYTMQLGSFPNEDKALTIWNNLQGNNPDLLAKLDADVLPASTEKGKNYYLRAGHYQWKEVAEASCSSLRTRNIDCLALPASANQHALASKEENKQLAKADIAPKPVDKNAPIDITKKSPAPDAYAQSTPAPANELPWMTTPGYKPRTTWTLPQDAALPPVNQQELPPLAKAEIPPQYQEIPQTDPAYKPSTFGQSRYQTQSEADAAPTANDTPVAKSAPAITAPPVATPAPAYLSNKQQTHDEISTLAKQDTLNKKLLPETEVKKEKNYNEFYKEIENKSDKRTPVSEAVLVPDDMYFSDSVSTSGPANNYLKIGTFADKEAANDYADRMFRYDENLSGLDISITGNQPKLNLLVGPLAGADANNLCSTIRGGGMQCSASSGGKNSKTASGTAKPSAATASPSSRYDTGDESAPKKTFNDEPEAAPKKSASNYWINMGTFGDVPEAEYYWTFLQEDNQDILANLKYKMVTPSDKGEHGNDAIQLQVGPFISDSRATQICNIMRYRNVACLVTQ
jgi:hypothetical protein